MNYNNRFKDAPWYNKSTTENIMVIGAGGISSNTLYNLAKTIPAKYHIIDFDTVEEYNVGCQFFRRDDVNKPKVNALQNILQEFIPFRSIVYNTPYSSEMYYPIMITGLDNMKTRKQVFETWKSKDNRRLFIDGRMKANLYEVFTVVPGREEEYEATLFDDNEVQEGPCTFKQTSYVGMMIGARITQIVVNYLTNYYANENICEVPFHVKELTEAFYYECKN